MNKIVLTLAIFAFCLFPQVLSSEMKGTNDRELGAIYIGNIGSIIGSLINSTKTTTNSTTTTNTTVPANNTSTSNTTAPVSNSTSTNTTAPVDNTTSSNTTVPTNNTSSSNDTSSTPANNTDSTNTTQPSNTNNTTNSTVDPTPAPVEPTPAPVDPTPAPAPVDTNWYAKNDVDMSAFKQKCLDIHNILRGAVGVAPLTWSDSLAASAQAWANDMAVNGFRHSGRTGENIASTSYSTKVTVRLLGLWTKEQDWFIKGCTYPRCSSTGAEVGHYTQMVWAKTTQVGCGFAPGVNKQWNYLCCQYYRAGNVIGQTVFPYPIPTN